MAGTGRAAATSLITLCLLSTLFLLQNLVVSVAVPNGFSMKLIHRDSKGSPLYPGDHLTKEERLQRLFEQSIVRVRHFASANNLTAGSSIDPEVSVPLPVSFAGSFYITPIGLGTFSDHPEGEIDFKNYFLLVDTGSNQIWTQCAGCTSCFHQDEPPFPYKSSSSFRPLPCNQHPLCSKKCSGPYCAYQQIYVNGASTTGILSSERFTVSSSNGDIESIDGIVFGCGLDQQNFGKYFGRGHEHMRPDLITGILGLGRGHRSFVTQLGDSAHGKFSYCLAPWTKGQSWTTSLLFGDNAQFPEGTQVFTTPLVLSGRSSFYYVNLDDISIGGQRIGFPPGSFALQGNGSGGVVIDSGAAATTLQKNKYMLVREHVIRYFTGSSRLVPRKGRYITFDLCYDRPAGFNDFPVIKFHFAGGADFIVEPEAGFFITDSIFCLAMHGVDHGLSAVIGAWQTTNQRLMFDPFTSTFSFAKEECKLNE